MIHRHDNGRIAFGATIRYAIALLIPFWDCRRDVLPSGRALTAREMAHPSVAAYPYTRR